MSVKFSIFSEGDEHPLRTLIESESERVTDEEIKSICTAWEESIKNFEPKNIDGGRGVQLFSMNAVIVATGLAPSEVDITNRLEEDKDGIHMNTYLVNHDKASPAREKIIAKEQQEHRIKVPPKSNVELRVYRDDALVEKGTWTTQEIEEAENKFKKLKEKTKQQ